MKIENLDVCLEKAGILDRCEKLALEAGWIPYTEPSRQVFSDHRINQNERMSYMAEGAGHHDLDTLLPAAEPRWPDDLELLKKLSVSAEGDVLLWHAVPRDVVSILVLAHCSQFDKRFALRPFKPELMKSLCTVLGLDWKIESSEKDLNG